MALGVVDGLGAVDVPDHDGKFGDIPVVDAVVHVDLLLHKGVLALDAGEGIGVGQGAGVAQLAPGLEGGAAQVEIIPQQGREGQGEETQHHKVHLQYDPVQLLRLPQDKGIGGKGRDALFLNAAVVAAGGDDGVERAVFKHLAHPHDGHEHDHGEQRHPDVEGVFKAAVQVVGDDVAEEEQADDGPENEDKVGFPLHGIAEQQIRQHQEKAEDKHDAEARAAAELFPQALFPLPRAQHRRGNHAVDDRRADGGHVHDPADAGAPEKGDEHGKEGDSQDGVFRRAVGAEIFKAGGQDAVTRESIQQAAQCVGVADEACENQRQEGEHQQPDPRVAQVMPGGIEGGQAADTGDIVQVADILQPVCVLRRVGRDGEEGHKDIKQRRHHDGDRQHPEAALHGEAELLRRVGDVLKAHKGPGGDEGDVCDLGDGGAVGDKMRRKAPGGPAVQKRENKADADAKREDQRQHRVEAQGEGPPLHAQKPEGQKGQDGDQRLAQPDLIAEERVEPAEAEHVPQKIAGEEREARGVGPEHGKIGQRQKPGDQKTVPIAEDFFDIGVHTARLGIAVHHAVVIFRDDEHHEGADRHAEGAAERPRAREVGVAGDDKGAPADTGADGQGPGTQGRYIVIESCSLTRFFVCHVTPLPFLRKYSKIIAFL